MTQTIDGVLSNREGSGGARTFFHPDTTSFISNFTGVWTIQGLSADDLPAVANNCHSIKEAHMDHADATQDFIQPLTGLPIVSIVLAAAVLVVNVVVIAAMLRSWNKLRQSIYIFALNIALCDAFLGMVFLGNSVHHLSVEGKVPDTDDALYMDATAWFFKIKTAIFMAAEVATAGNTALIATAFSRYVAAQLAHPTSERRSVSGRIRRTSVLLSRRKSYLFGGIVWIVSAAIFVVGLLWNCTKECLCFLSSGILVESHAAAECYFKHSCSFLFPSLKIYYGVACVVLFLTSLAVIIVMCSYTISIAGGMGVVLPYRIHLNLVRKHNKRRMTGDGKGSSSGVRRRHSIQISYMRNTTHFIIAVTTSYIICRLPANLLLLVDCLSSVEHLAPVKVVQALNLISFMQSFFNPVIFYLTLHRMKQITNDLFTTCCGQTIEVTRGAGSKNISTLSPPGDKSVNTGDRKRSIRFLDDVTMEDNRKEGYVSCGQ